MDLVKYILYPLLLNLKGFIRYHKYIVLMTNVLIPHERSFFLQLTDTATQLHNWSKCRASVTMAFPGTVETSTK